MTRLRRMSLVMLGVLLSLGSGCRPVPPDPVAAPPSPSPDAIAPSPTPVASVAAVATPEENRFQRGLDRAASAATLSQIAQSRDDWRLVASRWQQAIDQLRAIPSGHPDHGKAQQKIQEYQRNLTVAQARADRPQPPVVPRTTIREAVSTVTPATPAQPIAPPAPVSSSGSSPTAETVFRVPILRRAGGTPIINVAFNGQTFPMVLDTGASGTVITQQMAARLRVVPVGQARVNTASASNVTFPLGYVDSIQVGGAIAEDMLVAIAGPDLPFGLLGQDFFRTFDVTIREQEVEFRPR